MEISAYQLLYSRVEVAGFADIPHANIKLSGYQVVFHAAALAPDVSMIEKRVQCFSPKDNSTTRYQFFVTPSGKIAVTHTVRIEPDPKIIDQNQRQGAFIAHCLVFEASDFARLRNNPFAIIDNATLAGTQSEEGVFIVDPYDMRDVVANHEERVKLNIKRSENRDSTWDNRREQVNKLLALSMDGLGKQTLAFIGSNQEIEEVLYTLITLSDPRHRLNLTFDTNVDKCQPVPDAYFAAGASSRIPNSSFLNVDLRNPKIDDIKANNNNPKETGYSNWLKHSLETKSFKETLQLAPDVQTVATAFEDGELLREENNGAVAQAEKAFIEANNNRIMKGLEAALKRRLSNRLVDFMLRDIRAGRNHLSNTHIINIASQGKITKVTAIADAIYQAILNHKPDKLSSELKALEIIGQEAGDLRLQAIVVLNKSRPLSEQLVGFLRRPGKTEQKRNDILNAANQEGILTTLMDELSEFSWAHPANFLTAENVKQVTYHVGWNLRNYDAETVLDLLTALGKMGAGQYINKFTDYAKDFDEKQKKKLQKTLRKVEELNDKFKKAIGLSDQKGN